MAPRYVVAPPRNNAYVAMLGLAVGSMAFGCALLGLELSGYDPVPAFQAVSLPKVEPRSAPAATGTPAAAPVAPAGGSAKVEPVTPPAPVAVVPLPKPEPPPAVAKAEPPRVEPPKLEDPKRGPRPGFNLAAPPLPPPKP